MSFKKGDTLKLSQRGLANVLSSSYYLNKGNCDFWMNLRVTVIEDEQINSLNKENNTVCTNLSKILGEKGTTPWSTWAFEPAKFKKGDILKLSQKGLDAIKTNPNYKNLNQHSLFVVTEDQQGSTVMTNVHEFINMQQHDWSAWAFDLVWKENTESENTESELSKLYNDTINLLR